MYLVIKPLEKTSMIMVDDYIEAVKGVIKRMNFIIVDCKPFRLKDKT
jgi:hypothetical protein